MGSNSFTNKMKSDINVSCGILGSLRCLGHLDYLHTALLYNQDQPIVSEGRLLLLYFLDLKLHNYSTSVLDLARVLFVKEARKGFFGCYSVCETIKDTKEGYFIM